MKYFISPQKKRDTEIFKGKRDLKSFILKKLFSSVFICGLFFLLSNNAFSQKIAILTPAKNERSREFAEKLSASLENKLEVVDLSLADNVLRVKNFENAFNLSTVESKNLGSAIGCNFFIIIKSETWRRSSFQREKYFESNAVFYLVSSRTGRLVFWSLEKFEEDTPELSETKLFGAIEKFAETIKSEIKSANAKELNEPDQKIAELPDEHSPAAKGFRPPLPFRRIKPEYTRLASFYNVTATIDVLADIDADGRVLRTEIVRWAGFGLDESVIRTVNEMIWRPADRDGKTLPMRVLLRYNFRNIETEQ